MATDGFSYFFTLRGLNMIMAWAWPEIVCKMHTAVRLVEDRTPNLLDTSPIRPLNGDAEVLGSALEKKGK